MLYSLFPDVCSDSLFVEVLVGGMSSIVSILTTGVLEKIVKNVFKKVFMPQVFK